MKLIITLLLMLLTASPANALVVLQYHHVNENTPAVTSVSPDMFRAHMELLENEGMTIVDLYDATRKLQSGGSLPDNAVAITFDDAYQSIYNHALPELKKRGWPFTVFVSTGPVDSQFPDMMSWDDLRDLQSHGGRLANHTVSHAYLLNIPEDMDKKTFWESEILPAQKRLEAEAGVTEKLCAYPYGEFSLELADWMKQQGYLAYGQHSGAVGKLSHPQALPRFPASGNYANTETLRTKLHSLPFTIEPQQLAEPVLGENPPLLALAMSADDISVEQIRCYSGGEHTDIQREQAGSKILLEIRASEPQTLRRGRYNCTAPSRTENGRYYWYSQPWVDLTKQEPGWK